MSVGVVTNATMNHSMFALLTATVCTAAMTLILAMAQGVTRLMAGGAFSAARMLNTMIDGMIETSGALSSTDGVVVTSGILSSKQSAPEDKTNFSSENSAEDGRLPPYYEHVATMQKRENRFKLANRMHNCATNCYETPAICLIVFWGAYLACSNREYAEKIAQLSICFVVARFFYIFFFLAGLNLRFLPLRSMCWLASLGTAFAAGSLGIAGAQEALKTTEIAIACVDGVGCACKTAGCIVGVIVGSVVGFTFLVMLMSYVILSSTVRSDFPSCLMLPHVLTSNQLSVRGRLSHALPCLTTLLNAQLS